MEQGERTERDALVDGIGVLDRGIGQGELALVACLVRQDSDQDEQKDREAAGRPPRKGGRVSEGLSSREDEEDGGRRSSSSREVGAAEAAERAHIQSANPACTGSQHSVASGCPPLPRERE